jgi:hypothetical protein
MQADASSVNVEIQAAEWLCDDVDLLALDHRVHEAEDRTVEANVRVLVCGSAALVARAKAQVELRYQRLRPVYNRRAPAAIFAAIQRKHRALHDLHKPLVRADYEHSVDVWQWLLRLDQSASLAVQVAALFHDIERLDSEADVRVEHTARDYLTFKLRHAQAGARILLATLSDLELEMSVLERAASLVARHEQPEADRELRLLNDADALSFFSLNSPGFVRYYDDAHSAKKVAYTLHRMSPAARAWLPKIRVEHKVETLLRQAAA